MWHQTWPAAGNEGRQAKNRVKKALEDGTLKPSSKGGHKWLAVQDCTLEDAKAGAALGKSSGVL